MTKREAKRLAYSLAAVELDLAHGCGNIAEAPNYPDTEADQDRVEVALEEIMQGLIAKGIW